MTETSTRSKKLDRWADWLLHGRQRGHSEAQVRRMQQSLQRLRNRVLKAARLKSGHRVLDVGAGTGLLALEALQRVGPSGGIVAVDVSHDAMVECRRGGAASGGAGPLECVVGDALALPVASEAFDVVLTRSVLIYLTDKASGVRELHRVLKPGGRASIFEPINEVLHRQLEGRRAFFQPLQPEWGRIHDHYETRQDAWAGTLLGFDERDLAHWFEEAGFAEVAMTYEYEWAAIRSRSRGRKASIAMGIRSRPNPNTPSYEEVAREVLGSAADAYLERFAQFLLETGGPAGSMAGAYLVATK